MPQPKDVAGAELHTTAVKAPTDPATIERVARGVSNTNLPPSIEGAYYKKCIDIKRRIDEIEGNNDKRS